MHWLVLLIPHSMQCCDQFHRRHSPSFQNKHFLACKIGCNTISNTIPGYESIKPCSQELRIVIRKFKLLLWFGYGMTCHQIIT